MGKLPFEQRKPKVLVKKEGTTDKKFGCDPNKRSMDELMHTGIINVNKQSGPSSHQVSDYVKKMFGLKRAGHAGTLDPKVIGVLPIALDKSTKIVQALLNAGKEYVCLMYVHKPVSEKKIKDCFKEFTGKIQQLPPVKSAVKRQKRTREIYYVSILDIDKQHVLFKVGCQAGTYIRKLVHDLGKKLDTGAHMVELVRTKAGPFKEIDWHPLQEVRDAYEFYKEGNESKLRKIILPHEAAVQHLPKIWVFDNAVATICHGASLAVPGITKLDDDIEKGFMVAVLTLKGELICLSEAQMSSEEIIEKSRGVAATIMRVFMDRKVYEKTL